MLILEFCKEGNPISDFEAEETVKKLYNLEECSIGTVTIKISTANIIEAARALIADGELDHNKIAFEFESRVLNPNKNGRLEYLPNGFCDHSVGWYERILAPKKKETTNEH